MSLWKQVTMYIMSQSDKKQTETLRLNNSRAWLVPAGRPIQFVSTSSYVLIEVPHRQSKDRTAVCDSISAHPLCYLKHLSPFTYLVTCESVEGDKITPKRESLVIHVLLVLPSVNIYCVMISSSWFVIFKQFCPFHTTSCICCCIIMPVLCSSCVISE